MIISAPLRTPATGRAIMATATLSVCIGIAVSGLLRLGLTGSDIERSREHRMSARTTTVNVGAAESGKDTHTSPGASFCSSGFTASGVQSLTANPVPPVVMTRSTAAPTAVHSVTAAWMAARSSPTMRVSVTVQAGDSRAAKKAPRIWDDLSVEGSAAAVVETMRIATERVVGGIGGVSGWGWCIWWGGYIWWGRAASRRVSGSTAAG